MTVIVPDPPTGNNKELNINRKNTTAYINANPSSITFSRATRVKDGAGGYRTTREDLESPQVVRIIQASENNAVERRNSDGENVRPSLNMLTEWDADVAEGDQFVWKTRNCEVVYITDLGYELVCEVTVR